MTNGLQHTKDEYNDKIIDATELPTAIQICQPTLIHVKVSFFAWIYEIAEAKNVFFSSGKRCHI